MGTKKVKAKAKASGGDVTGWNADVPAHNQTWMYLFLRHQVATSFPDSQHIKMSQMAWWNPAASPDVRQIDAEKMSIELHRFFKDGMHRGYEDAFKTGFPAAIRELSGTLVHADNTVPNLAATIDRVFRFENEEDK